MVNSKINVKIECSIDYDKDSDITQRFYETIQNKFHYAITGNTATEIIYQKADYTKENMGLTGNYEGCKKIMI